MSRFHCFNGFDLESCNNLDEYHQGSLSPVGKPELPTSNCGECAGIDEPFHTKSTTMLVQDYEISFESGFMKEHAAVLEKELQNYMEFVRTLIARLAPEHLAAFESEQDPFRPTLNTEDLVLLFELPESEDFMKALSTYDKLREFLDLAVAKLPNEAAMELVRIAQQMLHHYEKNRLEIDGIPDLLELSFDKVSQLSGLRLINLNFIELGEERLEAEKVYLRFAEVFTATCLLVIAQYFENPYHEEESFDVLKRPLRTFGWDEEEESFESAPLKKRKFSF